MIREARRDELVDLLRIQRQALSDPNPGLLRYAVTHGPLVLVSTARTDPVGYALAVPGDDGAYLAELAVAAPYRRDGRGTAMIDALAEHLRRGGGTAITLTVHPDNDGAQEFYRSLGFVETRRVEEFYENGDAGVTMRRTVD